MILAGGHYKQTQHNYIIAAVLNIIISIVTVKLWGLVGVALGTLVALVYQTVWMAIYNSKNLLCWPIKEFAKQIIVDAVTVLVAVLVSSTMKMLSVSYISWIVLAIKVAIIWLMVIAGINYICYRDKLVTLVMKIRKKRTSQRK